MRKIISCAAGLAPDATDTRCAIAEDSSLFFGMSKAFIKNILLALSRWESSRVLEEPVLRVFDAIGCVAGMLAKNSLVAPKRVHDLLSNLPKLTLTTDALASEYVKSDLLLCLHRGQHRSSSLILSSCLSSNLCFHSGSIRLDVRFVSSLKASVKLGLIDAACWSKV